MASSTKLCTKADLMERIKEYDEKRLYWFISFNTKWKRKAST